jgi:hypothetical protein
VDTRVAYAFRTFPPFGDWPEGRSSAEWPESMALELGDRVSESWFSFQMMAAVMLWSEG